MRHEPRGAIANPEHTVKLVSAHALLAGTHQVDRHEPLVKRDMAVLEDRTDGYAELLTATGTLPNPTTNVGFSARFGQQFL